MFRLLAAYKHFMYTDGKTENSVIGGNSIGRKLSCVKN